MNSKELKELSQDIILQQFEYLPEEVIRRIDEYLEQIGPDDLTAKEKDTLYGIILATLQQ